MRYHLLRAAVEAFLALVVATLVVGGLASELFGTVGLLVVALVVASSVHGVFERDLGRVAVLALGGAADDHEQNNSNDAKNESAGCNHNNHERELRLVGFVDLGLNQEGVCLLFFLACAHLVFDRLGCPFHTVQLRGAVPAVFGGRLPLLLELLELGCGHRKRLACLFPGAGLVRLQQIQLAFGRSCAGGVQRGNFLVPVCFAGLCSNLVRFQTNLVVARLLGDGRVGGRFDLFDVVN